MALMSGIQNTLSGMKTAQAQLELIGRNVANVDTPGYTRKTAQQKNLVLAGYSAGVQLGDVKRNVNQGLLRSFLSSNSLTSNLSAKNEYLSKTEVLLGTPEGNNSLASNVSDLQKYFDSFAADVTSASNRYSLLSSAQTITSRLNYVSEQIQKNRGDADVDIKDTVASVNKCLDTLSELNDSIVKYNVLGYDGVADLQDQRDQVLRELSGYLDVSYFTRENGEIVVQTTGGVTLLDREPHKLSHSAIAQAGATSTYAGGNISGIMVDGQDITNQIKSGALKGLIEIRDVTLPSLQSQLDELAGVLKAGINQAHNQGTAFPNTPSELSGSRSFLDPANQNIRIDEGDVRFIIFDENGKQVSTASLGGNMGFTQGSMTDMADTVQNWLRSADGPNLPQATVSFDREGKLQINTGDSNYKIGIVDEVSSNPGSAQKDAKISFDANGDGQYDRDFSGFSSFFGLNDFFTSNTNEYIYDSKVLSPGANLGLHNTATIGFSDSSGMNFGEIKVYPNDSVQNIVTRINTDPALNGKIRASLVPNGSGYKLRIENIGGDQLEISDNSVPQSGLLDTLGLAPSNAGVSTTLGVRDDIKVAPELIANGSPVFNTTSGKYDLNAAANNIANAMAKVFSISQTFGQSGTIGKTDTTLSNYASTFVGNISSASSNAAEELAYQQTLTGSISLKEAQLGGVDIDEELSQMIVFQQTYAACAQAFTASKEILDMLLDIVK